jgi:NADH:ubiquinone oxidoreductase subunit 2 (subunit N)
MFLTIFFLNFLIEENINKVKYIHLIVVFFFFCLIFNSEFYLNSFFLNNFSNNDTIEIFYNLIDENKLFYCHFIFFASMIILTILFFGFYQNTLMKYSKDFEFTFLILLFFISSLCLFFSTQFIEVFICLECISFCSYVLIGMERVNKLNAITGIRYLILSTIPSCLVILGGIFIYENYGSFILNNVELFLESFAPISNNISFFENITLFNGFKNTPIISETNGY